MEYTLDTKIDQYFPYMCTCGNYYHDQSQTVRYYIPDFNGVYYSTNGNGTIGTLFEYIPDFNTDMLYFVKNQGRIFPSGLCPFLLLKIAPLLNPMTQSYLITQEQIELADIHLTILNLMLEITNMNEKEWNETKKELQPIEFKIDDERIQKTIINKKGLCYCGCKHELNGKEYDLVLLLNDKLIGIDLTQNILNILCSMCEEADIELWRIMFVYDKYRQAIEQLNEVNMQHYFHGKKDGSEYYNKSDLAEGIFSQIGTSKTVGSIYSITPFNKNFLFYKLHLQIGREKENILNELKSIGKGTQDRG